MFYFNCWRFERGVVFVSRIFRIIKVKGKSLEVFYRLIEKGVRNDSLEIGILGILRVVGIFINVFVMLS